MQFARGFKRFGENAARADKQNIGRAADNSVGSIASRGGACRCTAGCRISFGGLFKQNAASAPYALRKLGLFAGARRFRIAYNNRRVLFECPVKTQFQFLLRSRRQKRYVRNRAQKRNIEDSLMRFAVAGHGPRTVEHTYDRKILQRDIVNKLIDGALNKGRINRCDGL